MKAIVWTKYGPPEGLQLQEVPKPIPADDEVLIKIHATTVSMGDCEVRRLKLPLGVPLRIYIGLRKPKRITILGQELAGEVAAVGKDVTQYQVGDQVFAITGMQMGAYAEYACLRETPKGMSGRMALKPANMTFEEATAVPLGGLESVHFLRAGAIQPGEKVLINGAGGSIGTIGVQLAKMVGAEVTAVDSGDKLPMLQSIGADHVIDYTTTDFTKNGKTYDVIFDVVGKSPFSRSLKSLNANGRYLIANPPLSKVMRARRHSQRSGKKIFTEPANHKLEDLRYLTELIEAGKLKTVIDRRYPLAQVAEAHKYVESGRKQGNVIITVIGD